MKAIGSAILTAANSNSWTIGSGVGVRRVLPNNGVDSFDSTSVFPTNADSKFDAWETSACAAPRPGLTASREASRDAISLKKRGWKRKQENVGRVSQGSNLFSHTVKHESQGPVSSTMHQPAVRGVERRKLTHLAGRLDS